jgi:hypothetical protein
VRVIVSDIIVPGSVEGAKARLTEIEAERRKTGWERAAIVWAHTGLPEGRPPKAEETSADALVSQARMGELLGVSIDTIKRDRKAWKWAIEQANAPDVKPGEKVTLPTAKYPPTAILDGTEADARDQRGFAKVATDPAKVAEAIKNDPAIAEAITTAVADDPDAELRVTQKVWAKKSGANTTPRTLHPVTPMMTTRDYDTEFRDAFAVIDQCLRARARGEWKPKNSTLSLIGFGLALFAQRAEEAGPDVDIHDEIATFLAQEV